MADNLPPYYSVADGRPSSLGNHSSLFTAFNGDLSGSHFQSGHLVKGDALGTPTTGYLFTPEVAERRSFTVVNSTAGHNQDTDGNDGRTGYVDTMRTIVHQGNGDAIAHHATVSVSGQKAGATHFLAHPAGVLYGGAVFAAANKTNLTWGESTLADNGYDCRGTGPVINFTRNNDTGAHSNFWNGVRLNSNGSKFCESAYQAVGKWRNALDTTVSTEISRAVVMRQGQKIELHGDSTPDSAGIRRFADTVNGWDIGFDGTFVAFRAASSNRILYNESAIILANAPVTINHVGGINLSGTGAGYKVGGDKVLGERQTGWATPTGTANRATFDTSSVTKSQLAERVKALIDDLIMHGIIGA